MILIEVSQVSTDLLPIPQLKQHLRLGSGFAEDEAEDAVLEGYLRAALSAIEGRTGQVIFQRQFQWVIDDWKDPAAQPFPLAPVIGIDEVTRVEADGAQTADPLENYGVEVDPFVPRIRATTGSLPAIPERGHIHVVLTAGAATNWNSVPPDLAQAILLLAAHYYEFRHDLTLGKGCTPFGVTALLERYRPLRIGFGGGA